eukprot:CAMPEP_0117649384 /NCGR_PEP_ID=MMETSP0804-20121206/941_1 /TAXON_ID=1074897 /ORGANISM="Tetraselmis astigmatica, Strain CCMP880" /LENGTH=56 /DNA_ID=CAMNT_0005455113 /DNA_START=1322 /DNA_END=1489 /DNA_ORIENTATION=+
MASKVPNRQAPITTLDAREQGLPGLVFMLRVAIVMGLCNREALVLGGIQIVIARVP